MLVVFSCCDIGRHRSVATKMSIWAGDITKLEIDAIVNVANSTLLGGGEGKS